MNWAKYADKKGKTADFKSKERVVQEAVSEVKDENGKVVRQAVEEKKESYIVMSEKRWDAESGEALADSERQWSLSELEREKARYDANMARAKAYSDGLASAIADFKKL
jgi:flagellar hook assembly protein FlgD